MTVEMKENTNKMRGHSKVVHLIVALVLVMSFSMVTAIPVLAAPLVNSVVETAFGTDTTDQMGVATFNDVLVDEYIGYAVTASGYEFVTGLISVIDADVNKVITLTWITGVDFPTKDLFTIYPNPAIDSEEWRKRWRSERL